MFFASLAYSELFGMEAYLTDLLELFVFISTSTYLIQLFICRVVCVPWNHFCIVYLNPVLLLVSHCF